ncbi:LacI family DNA-binding transcriptional regulator [Myxosarcina sp. GI1]|uniref:LacI family DNA-binding transcriptional regulator n=1 Tax=Myxosarcina sp. GI1 TaxID=1541065 RepID=UPI00056961CE|nr:LacI family DNA-binding transcriptional regulator [Myxosarcina sp. GI1]
MSKQKVTIQDIARKAGVSHSTVSRALRDNPLISLKMRTKIQQLAREMKYTPNSVARSLQNQRTHTIGVVVTSIDDPFFAEVVNGIEEQASKAGLSIILSISHRDLEKEIAAIDNLHQRRVDGILVADSHINRHQTKQLARIDVPIIAINSQTQEQAEIFNSVSIDDCLGARLAVEHLISLGHTRIGYLGVGDRSKSNQQRLAGYQLALSVAGLPQNSDWIALNNCDRTRISDVSTGRQLLSQLATTGVTGIVCYNDMVAVGALLTCHELGISIPQDLSLVGFDGIALSGYVTPPLTTVCQPMQEMGRLAMQMLLDLLAEKPVENLVLLPYLVERGSSAVVKSDRFFSF